MCNYQGYEFGAGRYPDSYCINGMLHDADSDYLNDEDVPCPVCNRGAAIAWWFDRWEGTCEIDDARSDEEVNGDHMQNAISLVDDIRKNRGITYPHQAEIPPYGNPSGIYPAS